LLGLSLDIGDARGAVVVVAGLGIGGRRPKQRPGGPGGEPRQQREADLGPGQGVSAAQCPFCRNDDVVNAESIIDPRTVTPGTGEPPASQTITVPVTTDAGALILSVAPDDRDVTLSDAFLTPSGDRLASAGSLRPVTVTDTRPARPGWNVSAQVTDFATSAGDRFGGHHLGWTPTVVSSAPEQNVVPGAAVAPGFPGRPGLAGGATLATAAPGSGLGTARLGGELRLELPTETPPGTYRAVLTLTAI
jgi:hypothetical protein